MQDMETYGDVCLKLRRSEDRARKLQLALNDALETLTSIAGSLETESPETLRKWAAEALKRKSV